MTTKEVRTSRRRFTFHNANPKGKLRAADCVPRAISTATGISWEEATRVLTEEAIKQYAVLNEKSVYDKWLTQNGWTKNKQPRKADNTKYTVEEFAAINDKGTYVVGVANHLTVVVDGQILDTWNCSYKTVGNYWSK